MSKSCCNEASSNEPEKKFWFAKYRPYFPAVFSFLLLATGIVLEQVRPETFKQELQLLVYGIAYYAVGKPVVWKALKKLFTADLFNEFFLMSLATIGAFAIGAFVTYLIKVFLKKRYSILSKEVYPPISNLNANFKPLINALFASCKKELILAGN